MRKSRFTDAQIIGMIKEQEAGLPTAALCRKHGLSPATFYKLKAKYGGMDLSDTKLSYSPTLGQIFGLFKLLPSSADRFQCC
jgi:putative transposase